VCLGSGRAKRPWGPGAGGDPVIDLDPRSHRAVRALMLLLFVLSGGAALIYEIVWFQLLRLTIGASAISLGIILATFMGGMCLGSFFFHRFVADRHHPLAAYGLLELGLAAFGVLNPLLIPLIGKVYFSFAGYGYGEIALRGVLAGLFLLPPTILMGATLPAIARWVGHSRHGTASLGFFYAANIAGAVLGCMLAGFYLLRVFDVYVTSGVAVLADLLACAGALALARTTPRRVEEPEAAAGPAAPPPTEAADTPRIRVLWVIGLSGLTALGAQVVWTRLLSLYFGGTVYTFSVILAVFLVGLGLGSTAGTRLAHTGRPLWVLAAAQLLLVPAVWWGQFAIQDVIHHLFFFGTQPSTSVQESHWIAKSCNDLVRAAVVLAPATFLWGASFPLALVLAAGGRDPGRFTGQVYAANTLGAVGGALLWSMAFIPLAGTRAAQQALMAIALLAAALLWAPEARRRLAERRAALPIAAPLAAVALGAVLVALLPASNPDLLARGRKQLKWGEDEYLAIREGVNSTVAVSRQPGGEVLLHVGGKIVASSGGGDMRLQRQLGHLPMLLQEHAKKVLIIGFGAGVTAGTFTRYPEVERIVIVEIEPAVPELSSVYFKAENYDVAHDPRTEIIIDDGRHFLATTDETFDVITTDPIHPWVKGAAALYTTEFYDRVKARLNPGGLITQWVPLYESDEDAVKSQVATFLQAFPEGSLWNSQENLFGYDLTLLGHVGPLRINGREVRARVGGNPAVRASLGEVGIGGLVNLLELYSGNRSDVAAWLADAQINRDRNLRLEYLAGTALDVHIATRIYWHMIDRIAYPSALFDLEEEPEAILRDYFRGVNAEADERRRKLTSEAPRPDAG